MRSGVFFPFLLVAMFIMSCSSFTAANSYDFNDANTKSDKIVSAPPEVDEERDARAEGAKRVANLGEGFLKNSGISSETIAKMAKAAENNQAMSVENILRAGGLKNPTKVIKLLEKNKVDIKKAFHDRDLSEIFKLVQIVSLGKKKSLTKKMFIVLASLFGVGGILYCLYIMYKHNQAPPGESTAKVGNTASSEDSEGSDEAEFGEYMETEGSVDSMGSVTSATAMNSLVKSPELVETLDSSTGYESLDSFSATDGGVDSSVVSGLHDSATLSGSSDSSSAVVGVRNMLNPKYMKTADSTEVSTAAESRDSSTLSEIPKSSAFLALEHGLKPKSSDLSTTAETANSSAMLESSKSTTLSEPLESSTLSPKMLSE